MILVNGLQVRLWGKKNMSNLLEFEGTWEDVKSHDHELSGHFVRITVLDNASSANPSTHMQLARNNNSLSECAGTWVGDDFEECYAEMVANRTLARF